MYKKTIKIAYLIFIILILSCTFVSNFVLASDNYNVQVFENKDSGAIGTSIETAAGTLLYVIKIIAVGVGLIMLAVLAMKYMMSSAQERATIKQSAMVYIIGSVVLFGAAGILDIIETFVNNNMK